MRLFITGGSGLLGSDLVPAALSRGHEVFVPSSTDFDVTDPDSSARLGSGKLGSFHWVINLAAYTNVDGAETETQKSTELNVLAPSYLAATSLACGARFLHISTDYVFGGADADSYSEDDPLSPIQAYGESKAQGEESVTQTNPSSLIARVSWLYGPGRKCFPLGLIDNFKAGKPMRIVEDQWGVPSYTGEVSRMLLDLIGADAEPGIYHVAGSDAVSRFEYADAVARAYAHAAGVEVPVMTPVPSTDFPTPAARPRNSVILTDKVRSYTQPHMPIDAAMAELVKRLA